VGEKAVIREATGKLVGIVREGVEQGRERMIFASEEQRDRLPSGKGFDRRPQPRLRCSDRTPSGEYVPPPGCCVELSEAFARGPDVALCNRGLHSPAPEIVVGEMTLDRRSSGDPVFEGRGGRCCLLRLTPSPLARNRARFRST